MTESQPQPPRVAIYARVSTTRQETENQVRELRAYASRMGWEVVSVLEETEHGWEPDREKLRALFDMASRREVDIALVWALDRFSRQGIGPTLRLVETLDSFGVRLWSYRETFIRETDPNMTELILSWFAWFAKQERDRNVERTLAGIARARSQGKVPGRPPRKVEPETLRQIVTLRDSGKSWREIAQHVRIPTATVRRLHSAVSKPGGKDEGAKASVPKPKKTSPPISEGGTPPQ